METLIIEKTKTTPHILFDKNLGRFEITGRSLPEDVIEFYKPVIEWVKKYLENPNPETVLTFEIEYLNTSSSKAILDIIYLLKFPYDKGFDVKVNWKVFDEDEDLMELGEDYSSFVPVPFTFSKLVGIN